MLWDSIQESRAASRRKSSRATTGSKRSRRRGISSHRAVWSTLCMPGSPRGAPLCAASSRLFQARNPEFALAPHGLPSDAGPFRRPQVRHKFGEIAFVFGFSDESADRVRLARAAAAARADDLVD